MEKLGGLVCLFGVVVLGVYFFTDELLLFIMAGQIPFTNLFISPIGMLLFWILIVPSFMLFWRIGSQSFWSVIGAIGAWHQRTLNRRIRQFMPPLSSRTICLIATALLAIETERRQPLLPTPAMRRRLEPLPI